MVYCLSTGSTKQYRKGNRYARHATLGCLQRLGFPLARRDSLGKELSSCCTYSVMDLIFDNMHGMR